MLKILLNPNIPNLPNFPNHPKFIYQHKKPFIYQDKLLKAQAEAKKNNRGIWSK